MVKVEVNPDKLSFVRTSYDDRYNRFCFVFEPGCNITVKGKKREQIGIININEIFNKKLILFKDELARYIPVEDSIIIYSGLLCRLGWRRRLAYIDIFIKVKCRYRCRL